MAESDKERDRGAELERFFAAARAETPAPDAAFLDGLRATARAAAEAHGAAGARVPRPRPTLRGLLGGWPGIAGLGAAALGGLWIGLAPPAGLEPSFEALWSDPAALATHLDPALGFDSIAGEG